MISATNTIFVVFLNKEDFLFLIYWWCAPIFHLKIDTYFKWPWSSYKKFCYNEQLLIFCFWLLSGCDVAIAQSDPLFLFVEYSYGYKNVCARLMGRASLHPHDHEKVRETKKMPLIMDTNFCLEHQRAQQALRYINIKTA